MHAQPLNAIVGKTIVAQHQRTHNNKARVPTLEMFTNVFNEFFGNDNSTTCTTQCISQKCYNTFGSISTWCVVVRAPVFVTDKTTKTNTRDCMLQHFIQWYTTLLFFIAHEVVAIVVVVVAHIFVMLASGDLRPSCSQSGNMYDLGVQFEQQ